MSSIGVIRSSRMVLFGQGQRHALPSAAAEFGERVFICTDGRWNSDPLLQGIAQDLHRKQLRVSVYDRTIPELPVECIDEASNCAREFAPDVVIGIGGGSALDLAKLVALRLRFSAPLSEFYGEFKVPGPLLPLIAVPTTAGTGSEATPVAVVSDPERVTKVGISSPHLIPEVAICDPELTLSCPAGLTAVVGADALTHAIEAFTAVRKAPSASTAFDHVFIGKNDLSDGQAVRAIQALGRNLEAAVSHGQDLDARHHVMMGSFLAGQAFGVAGTAAAHAIQYPIGASTKTPHGLGVAALMPYVLAFNLPARVAEIAEIGVLMGGKTSGSTEAQARAAIAGVAGLFHRIGIPRTLAELGLRRDQIDWVAEHSMSAARLVNNNPRSLDVESVRKITVAAFEGDLARLMNEG